MFDLRSRNEPPEGVDPIQDYRKRLQWKRDKDMAEFLAQEAAQAEAQQQAEQQITWRTEE